MNIKKHILAIIMALVTIGGLAIAVPAFAQTSTTGAPSAAWAKGMGGRPGGMRGRAGLMKPAIVGTVSSVNGNSLTVSGRQGFATSTAATIFNVDATNATVKKNNATSTVSSIAVGDMVVVQGTVNGTNIAATMIRDGLPMRAPGAPGGKTGWPRASSTPPVLGNGQPIVAGTISAISGLTLTVTNKSNVVYTVDVSNAKILQGQTTLALSNLNVGDSVVIQGTVNGTSIAATTVLDQTQPAGQSNSGQTSHPGFFAGIGDFFKHLFGF